MRETVIDCGEQGMFFVEIAKELGVAKQTLYQWREQHPEFADALMCARELSEAYHAKVYREGCANPSSIFNAEGYRKMMAVVFEDWRTPATQVELTGRDGRPIETRTAVVDVSALNDAQLEALERAADALADAA